MNQEYQVETFNIVTGETTHRTITPLPTPQRIQPAKPITKGELTGMINTLRQEMGAQQERFDNKAVIDKERADRRADLSAKLIALIEQQNAVKAELDQLTREGTVREQFIAFAKDAERRIFSIATGVYNYLLEKISNDRHEASYKELTPLLKEDVEFRVSRSGIRGLTQPSFARLHAKPADQIFNSDVEATLNKVYDATEKLEKVLEK
jgi:hypothetical protein